MTTREDFGIKKLDDKTITRIERERSALLDRFRHVPKEGKYIDYLDKKFIVYPNCFWPFDDSKPLVKNFIVNPGESVLDVGTGSGLIAIFAAYKGAGKVVVVDLNPAAIKSAKENIKIHGFEDIIEVRKQNTLNSLEEKFDVIISNPPFTNKIPRDIVFAAAHDQDFGLHKNIFDNANRLLKDSGRLYLAQANFGNLEELFELTDKNKFRGRLIGRGKIEKDPSNPREFYAFEFTKINP